MENTQKIPEMWFQMLKEPYRSEAIVNIDKEYTFFKDYPESLEDALENSFNFFDHDQAKWITIFNSIRNGETTYIEPETLKPEQMESGKWYLVTITDSNNWLIKFDKNNLEYCYHQIGIFMRDGSIYNYIGALCLLNEIKSITPATKEEVLKYFPDEVFEPIELRPEKPTDWEAMYNELKVENGSLKVGYMILEEKYNELKAKYDQLEPKGEKVYFYFDYLDNLIKTTDFEFALHESSEDSPIYKAVCIGKKKSVLVNE